MFKHRAETADAAGGQRLNWSCGNAVHPDFFRTKIVGKIASAGFKACLGHAHHIVVPHYNVMGVAKASLEASTRYLAYDLGPKKIRVNCISAGPVQTLAARGISGFTSMLKHYQERAPLKRSCEPAELGATGVFLASDGAAAITGQVIYVDGGYQIIGM